MSVTLLSSKKSQFLLALILLFAFLTRVLFLNTPTNYYFDEQYHVPAAKLLLHGKVSAFEWWHDFSDSDYPLASDSDAFNESNFDWLHPPIAKYIQALSMGVLGENFWGWRLPSVLFGVMVVRAVYALTQVLFDNKAHSLLASLLSALSGLLLVQSRIAMNDIFVTFWILMFFYFYVKAKKIKGSEETVRKEINKNVLISGIFFGLAVATKWSGVFALGYILFYETKDFIIRKKKNSFKTIPWMIFCFLIVPSLIYFMAYLPMFMAGKSLEYFVQLHQQIFYYQWHVTTSHVYQSQPWQWFFNLRPVWYWTSSSQNSIANIYALENPAFALGGFVSVLMSAVWVAKMILARSTIWLNHPLFQSLIMYGVVWLPWVFSPRITFFYHYTLALPVLCILMSFWLIRAARTRKMAVLLFLLFTAVSFGVYYPHWTGLPVSKGFVERVYFLLPSWR